MGKAKHGKDQEAGPLESVEVVETTAAATAAADAEDDDVAPRKVTREGVVAAEGARYADRSPGPEAPDEGAEDGLEAAPRRKKLKAEVYEAELAGLPEAAQLRTG